MHVYTGSVCVCLCAVCVCVCVCRNFLSVDKSVREAYWKVACKGELVAL